MVENGGNENAMEAMDDGTWTASTCWRVYNRPKGEGGGLETVRIWAGPLPTAVASADPDWPRGAPEIIRHHRLSCTK